MYQLSATGTGPTPVMLQEASLTASLTTAFGKAALGLTPDLLCWPMAGQIKNCLLEPLTDKNSWLEVKLKRAGREAAWERLDEVSVPEDLLAAFVQEKRRTRAIPLPGTSPDFVGSDPPPAPPPAPPPPSLSNSSSLPLPSHSVPPTFHAPSLPCLPYKP